MAQSSYLWDSGGGGDASPHSESATADLFKAIMRSASALVNKGVVPGMLNELAVTVNGTNLDTATGYAIVDGHPYYNSAIVSTAIAAGSGGGTGIRLVLRCSWSAQTVRLTEIRNTPGTSAAPAMTQTPGTTYDIPLVYAIVSSGGTITIQTDERSFIGVDVQTFTTSGTWTRPSRAGKVLVRAWGAGGGGGSGRSSGAGTNRPGGGAGGGGGYVERWINPSLLGTTETVTVSATGGAGGIAVGSGTNGNAGSAGGNSTFGTWVTATGGGGGAGGDSGGNANGGAGGAGSPVNTPGAAAVAVGAAGNAGFDHGSGGGGGGNGSGVGPGAGGSALRGGAGGGGGFGTNASNTDSTAGAAGGASDGGSTAGGGAGNPGTAGTSGAGRDSGGSGGGGGSVNGATGGAGGARGGGGGGGAGHNASGTSGAGGAGGGGYIEVISYF